MLGRRFFEAGKAESVGQDDTARAWEELANLGQESAMGGAANAGEVQGVSANAGEVQNASASVDPNAGIGEAQGVNVNTSAVEGVRDGEVEEETLEEYLAGNVGEQATEFLGKKFPQMSENGRKMRVQRAIKAALGRMRGAIAGQAQFFASRGEELSEEAEDELENRAELDVQHIMEDYYSEGSRIMPEGAGDEMSEDEAIAWDLAEEPHKPGTLNLTMLFMQNPRREGEGVEEYKQRIHNYSKQDLVREEQLRKDAEYEQQMAARQAEMAENAGAAETGAAAEAEGTAEAGEREKQIARMEMLFEEAQRRISTCEDMKTRMRLVEASAKVMQRLLELQAKA